MRRKRTLSSPNAVASPHSFKQSKLEKYLLSQDSTLDDVPLRQSPPSSASLTLPPPLDESQLLLNCQQPSQDVGIAHLDCEVNCESSKTLRDYSHLTAQTVASIFSKLSYILNILKEQHHAISNLSNLSTIPASKNVLDSCLHCPASAAPIKSFSEFSADLPSQLVYSAHAAVLSFDYRRHPDWSKIFLVRRHLTSLLRVPASLVDLRKISFLPSASCSFRLLLEFHSASIPRLLFDAIRRLQEAGITAHRYFRNNVISKLFPSMIFDTGRPLKAVSTDDKMDTAPIDNLVPNTSVVNPPSNTSSLPKTAPMNSEQLQGPSYLDDAKDIPAFPSQFNPPIAPCIPLSPTCISQKNFLLGTPSSADDPLQPSLPLNSVSSGPNMFSNNVCSECLPGLSAVTHSTLPSPSLIQLDFPPTDFLNSCDASSLPR